ncbi:unnamed protein product [Hermetia illucens]|uniref:Uncharacterized protein n=2 Tax=Hermetia illucens TaxID=343691 RepID=A0A7R8V011_HERIL|nr:uncharacterized protein LOC119656997 isoform X1 [Hermetia illucens]CAD7090301.1 unnamed protein product [Hermetia illucens]
MGRRIRMSDVPPSNPYLNPTSTLAYGILASTSAWSLYWVKDKDYRPCSVAMFSLMLAHAMIAVLRYGHPNSGKAVRIIYEKMTMICQYVMLPLVNMDIYLSTKMPRETAYMHVITIVLPALSHFMNERVNILMVDISAIANIASCLYLGYLEDNPWAMGLAAVAAMNHFIYSRIANHVSAPKQDLLAVGLSFFNLFSVQTLNSISSQRTLEFFPERK